MFAIRFGTAEHFYGCFPTVAKADWWARLEGDRTPYTIHKIAAQPKRESAGA